MKNIESISIWDNGQIKEGLLLNAYAVNVTLGTSAVFYYSILSDEMQNLAQGNITMDGEDYQAWESDDVAWSFIASKLNLTITGDYVHPVIEPDAVNDTVNDTVSDTVNIIPEEEEPSPAPPVEKDPAQPQEEV
jgi:hypothetical protein